MEARVDRHEANGLLQGRIDAHDRLWEACSLEGRNGFGRT